MDGASPYNIFLGQPNINSLGAVTSTLYLTLKYPLPEGRVGTIRGDHQEARECYLSSMETAREDPILIDAPIYEVPHTNFECWDLRLGAGAERHIPMEDLKKVHIDPNTHQLTKIGIFLSADEERGLVNQLIKNIDLFAKAPPDMPGIEPKWRAIASPSTLSPS